MKFKLFFMLSFFCVVSSGLNCSSEKDINRNQSFRTDRSKIPHSREYIFDFDDDLENNGKEINPFAHYESALGLTPVNSATPSPWSNSETTPVRDRATPTATTPESIAAFYKRLQDKANPK